MSKAAILIAILLLLFGGSYLYSRNNSSSPVISQTINNPAPTASLADPRASDPNDPLYKELIETKVVKAQQQLAGPTARMAILSKHQNDIAKLNIYLPEDGGHGAWVQKVNGNWILLYSGQQEPDCSKLEKAGIEAEVMCLNPNIDKECVAPNATYECFYLKTR